MTSSGTMAGAGTLTRADRKTMAGTENAGARLAQKVENGGTVARAAGEGDSDCIDDAGDSGGTDSGEDEHRRGDQSRDTAAPGSRRGTSRSRPRSVACG
eukprot:gene15250-biopygen10082